MIDDKQKQVFHNTLKRIRNCASCQSMLLPLSFFIFLRIA